MLRTRLFGIALIGALALAPAVANADSWGRIVTMGSITSNTLGRLCSGIPDGFGKYFDIHCPSYAPSITTAGDVSVTGNLSAAQFIGDGSGLTGITANQIGGLATDRIISGTTSILASQNTSLTFTTSNTQRMVIGDGGNIGIGTAYPGRPLHIVGAGELMRLQATTGTNNASALLFAAKSAYQSYTQNSVGSWMGGLDGYDDAKFKFGSAGGFTDPVLTLTRTGNVGISTSNPNAKLDVYGTVSATSFVGDGSGLTGITADATDRIVSGTTRMVVVSNTGYVSLTQAGTNTGWFSPYTGLVTLGVSATGPVSGSDGYFNGKVGIGISNPVDPLHVNGNVRIEAGQPVLALLENDVAANSRRWRLAASDETLMIQALTDGGVGGGNNFKFNRSNEQITSYMGYAAGLPWFTASNALQKVGIGSITPTATLQVSGSLIVSTSGQTTTPSLYVGTDGNVGIGTASPQRKFVVAADYPVVGFKRSGSAQDDGLGWGIWGDSNGVNDLIFTELQSTDWTQGNNRLVLKKGGNVGISTTSPLARLDVNGTISASDAIQIGTSSLACSPSIGGAIRYATPSIQVCNGSSWVNISGGGGGGSAVSNTGAIQFNAGGSFGGDTDNLYWDNANKRLGIGTSTPTTGAALTVSGGMTIKTESAANLVAERGSNGMLAALTVSDTSDKVGLGFYGYTANYGVPYLRNTMMIYADNSTDNLLLTANANTGTIRFHTGGYSTPASERMTIGPDGNVGIGTSAPQKQLHISGVGGAQMRIEGTDHTFMEYYVSGSRVAYSGVPSAVANDTFEIKNEGTLKSISLRPSSDSGVGIGSGVASRVPSATLHVFGTTRITSWTTIGSSVTPTAELDVYGKVSATALKLALRSGGAGVGGGVATPTWYDLTRIPSQVQAVSNSGSISMASVSASTLNSHYLSSTQGYIGTLTGGTAMVGGFTVTGNSSQKNVSITNLIQMGMSAQACSTGVSGSLRYNNTSDTLQICTSGGWVSLVSNTSGLGATAAASSTGAIQFNAGGGFGGDTNNLYWDNANKRLGVGTLAPSSSLHVYGNAPTFRLMDDNDAASYFEIQDTADTQTVLKKVTASGSNMIDLIPAPSDGTSAAKVRLFRTTNTTGAKALEIFRGDGGTTIDHFLGAGSNVNSYLAANGGRVGIGTNIPALGTLEVVSSSDKAMTTPLVLANPNNTSDTSVRMVMAATDSAGANQNGLVQLVAKRRSSGAMDLSVLASPGGSGAPTQRMLIDGQVGAVSFTNAVQIGTSSLACASSISGSIRYNNTSDTLQVCTSGGWVSLVSGTVGATAAASSTGAVQFNAGGGFGGDTANLYWDNANKRLGVGINTPARDLHVYTPGGGGDGIGQFGSAFGAMVSGDSGGRGVFGSNLYVDGSQAMRTAGTHATYGYAGMTAQWGNLNFYTSDGATTADAVVTPTTRMYISTGGNVGIGTSGPQAPLHVVSTSSGGTATPLMVDNAATGVANTAARIHLSTSGNVARGTYIEGINTSGGSNGNALAFGTGANNSSPVERMRITKDGAVGIGTDNPQGTFHVSSSSWATAIVQAMQNDPVLMLSSDTTAGNAGWRLGMDVSDDDLLDWRFNNSRKMILTKNGKVRVGDATIPAGGMLEVAGTISASDAIQVSGSSLTCGSGIPGAIRYNSGNIQYCNGSGWTSLSSNTTVASVDGAGSANHIAYWSDADTLTYDGNQLYWDATNNRLGIGNASPAYRLVVGDGSTGSAADYDVAEVQSRGYAGLMLNGDYGNGGSEPGGAFIKLGMDGSKVVTDNWSSLISLVQNAGSDGTGSSYKDTIDNSFLIGTRGAMPFQFGTNSETRVTIATNGRVGIRTSYPSETLHVLGVVATDSDGDGSRFDIRRGGSIVGSMAVRSYNDDALELRHPDGAGGTRVGLIMDEVDGLYLRTLNTNRIAIKTDGKVGIGTTSPAQELDVAGDINLSGATSRTISFGTTGVAAPGAGSNGMKLQLYGSTPGVMSTNDFALGIESGNLWFNSGSATGGFKWYNRGTVRMTMLDDKLGIGTTLPSTTLHIQHYNSYTTPDTASYPLAIRNSSWNGSQITGMEFWNGPNKVVPTSRILSQMAGSGNAGERLIFQTQPSHATNPNPNLPTTKMVIANDGNVGIGTSLTPPATLYVDGTISSTDAIQVGSSSLSCTSGIPGAMRYNNASLEYCNGSSWTSLSSSTTAGVAGAGSANHIAYWSAADTLNYDSNQLYWNASTNRLGIGTATPGASLSVAGDISITGEIYTSNGSNGTPSYNFSGDTNTGMYNAGADTLGFTTGGTQRGRFFSGGLIVTGYVSTSGAVDIGTQALGNAADAVGTPTYSWTGDTNAGMYRIAGDIIGFTTNGGERVRMSASGVSSSVNFFAPNGSASNPGFNFASDTDNGMFRATTNEIAFTTGGSEAVRIKANGNVGILNTNPAAPLDVTGSISASDAIQVGTSSLTCTSGIPGALRYNSGAMEFCNGSSWTDMSGGGGSGITSTTTMVSNWPDAIACNNGSARIVLNRTAWWSSGSQRARYAYTPDIANYYVEYDASGDVYAKGASINSGAYADCDNESITTLYGSGRAFNFIGGATWSQDTGTGAVTYSGGKVGIGTTSPSQLLEISNNPGAGISLNTTGSGPRQASLIFGDGGNYKWQWRYNPDSAGDALHAYSFTAGADVFSILATGKVGIGTNAPGTTFDVNGNIGSMADQYVYSYKGGSSSNVRSGLYLDGTNMFLRFYTGTSERMRVDASGNVSIGHTSAAGRLDVRTTGDEAIYAETNAGGATIFGYNTGANYGVRAYSQSSHALYAEAATHGYGLYGRSGSTAGYAGVMGYNYNSTYYGTLGGNNGYGIYCYGTYCGGNVAWSPASDARLKEHVNTLGDAQGLDLIAKLRPVTFHWKDSNLDKARGLQYGFIAQEVEKVIPEVVVKGEASMKVHHADGTVETVSDTKAMDYGAVVVPLVKAVQQLKAENEQLASETLRMKAVNDNLEVETQYLKRRLDLIERKLQSARR